MAPESDNPHDPVSLLTSAMPTNAAEGAQLRPFLLPNGGLVHWPRPSHHWPAMLRAQELKLRLKVSVTAFSAISSYFQVPCPPDEILLTGGWVFVNPSIRGIYKLESSKES
jgi:hypothetical protein